MKSRSDPVSESEPVFWQALVCGSMPLLAVLLVFGLVAAGGVACFWWVAEVSVPAYIAEEDARHCRACRNNLRLIGSAMASYFERHRCYPETRSGIQFLLAPLREGTFAPAEWSLEKIVRSAYICAGDDFAVQLAGDVAETYRDLENLDPSVISYAGRNTIDYPLDRNNATREAIACDAGGSDGLELNHCRTIHVLYLDGHVETIDTSVLPRGDQRTFEVGPDSPIPVLRTLNKDN